MKNVLTVADIFAGIGGFSYGLEATGRYKTKLFCEIDTECQSVLRHHWPGVPVYDDVTKLHLQRGEVDVITAGFPCQDISKAGHGAGIHGPRSSLVFEVLRLMQEVQPRYVIFENTPVLRKRGLVALLTGIANIGYDAEWRAISAAECGASHKRDRLWIVAYPTGVGMERVWSFGEPVTQSLAGTQISNSAGDRLRQAEPDLRRSVHGVSRWMDRLHMLGNSVYPPVVCSIGESVIQHYDKQHPQSVV